MENKKKIRLAVWVIILLGMLLIFPVNIIQNEKECASGGVFAYKKTESLLEDAESCQTFSAQYDYLKRFGIAFSLDDESEKTGDISICLKDENGDTLKTVDIPVAELSDSSYCDMPMNVRLRKGEHYQVSVQIQGCSSNIPGICYTIEESQHTAGNINLTVNGKEVDGQAVTRYIYGERISVSNILCLWLFLICIGFAVTEWLDGIWDKRESKTVSVS